MTVQRRCKREQSQACLNFAECSLSSNTVQRYKKNRQNAIVVPNHVPPCPESRASLSLISLSLSFPSHFPFPLIPFSFPFPSLSHFPFIPLSFPFLSFLSSWRCTANCIPTCCQLRPDVPPAASGRTARCIATQFWGHRQPVDERGTSSPKSDKVTRP